MVKIDLSVLKTGGVPILNRNTVCSEYPNRNSKLLHLPLHGNYRWMDDHDTDPNMYVSKKKKR